MPKKTILLHGDYEYLSEGYYASLAAEFNGSHPAPTCADSLDAYVVPIALVRVAQAGLPVPSWYLTNEYFTAPAILYGVNPFARSHALVLEQDQCKKAAKSMSRKGKFVMCCQELAAGDEIVEFEQVLGWSPDDRFASWAAAIYELFTLPIASVRLIRSQDQYFFSAVERLPHSRLSPASQEYLAQHTS